MIAIVYTGKQIFFLIICKEYLWRNYNINVKLFSVNSNKLNLLDKKKDIVIPLSIEARNKCYELNFEKCLTNSSILNTSLDDKAKCSEILNHLNIPIIPTFSLDDSEGDSISKSQKIKKNLIMFCNKYNSKNYIVKYNRGKGSYKISTYSKLDLINNLDIDKYTDYVIQPYLENVELLAIDCLCKDGKIVEFIINNAPLFYKKNQIGLNKYYNFYHYKINENNIYFHRIVEYSKKIIEGVNYSGFIEIEYLCNKKDNTVLTMEINPRISGNISFIAGNKLPYIDIFIIGYINIFNNNYKPENIKFNRLLKMRIYVYILVLALFIITIIILLHLYGLIKK